MNRIHRLVLVLACLLVLLGQGLPSQALAGIEPGQGKGWLTIASRSNANDAIVLARQYADRFPTAVVFGSSNGYFAVSLGWSDTGAGQGLLQQLKATGAVPQDSYFTAGKRFTQIIWSAGNVENYQFGPFLNATRLILQGSQSDQPQNSPINSRQARVTGLDATGDNYLSLRTGPGTQNAEIARMRADTIVTVTGESNGWYQVSLSNGMRGWAFSRYLGFQDIPLIGPDQTAGRTSDPDPPQEPEPESVEPPQQAAVDPEPQHEPQRDPPAIPADQKRVALVLGNSEYVHTAALPNPKNDAAAISARLERLGFEVVSGLDGTKAEMERSVREFVKLLPGADVALFFYAGHAMQVDGRNYMIPVDAKLEDSTAIDFETIDLGVVLNFMNNNNRISIALLDACRDNPLSRRFARSFGSTRSAFIGRGLAAPNTGAGEMLIGFATAPGEVALDGDGGNSPFTTALLRHIEAKGLDIELMLKRVRQDVYEMTDESQEPWVNSALRREFQFNPD